MNNTTSTLIQNSVNKLPISIFFEQLPDRQQVIKYINWLFTNVPETKNVNQDQFFREVISKELRIVNMKIIETEILLVVGLNTITMNDFTIDSKSLIKKLISENPDNYDLDIMYRIMSQIMSKLPKDLKERINGKQKLEIFQKIAQYVNIDNKLLEKFVALDPTLNTPGEFSMELDKGDYNTLNKQYLDELKKYEDSKGYINSNSIEYSTIAKNMINTTPTNMNNKHINAEYIDNQPDFMLGKNDDTLYYFDSSSGTLSEMPLNNKQTPVSLNDLKTILTGNKVKKNEVQNVIDVLRTNTTNPTVLTSENSTTQPSNFFDTIGSYFTSLTNTNATATTSSTLNNTIKLPEVPKYMQKNDDSSNSDNPNTIYVSQKNNLEKKFQERANIYTPSSTSSSNVAIPTNNTTNFVDRKNNKYPSQEKPETFTNMNEELFLNKIKYENKNIENVALSLITIIILVFLLVMFNSIKK